MAKSQNSIEIFLKYIISLKSKINIQSTISKREFLSFKVDGYDLGYLDSFVLQGICQIDDTTLVTAYDQKHLENSKVFIIKDKTCIHSVDLNTKSHVGGICYDPKHKNIWITDSGGTISAYKLKDILKEDIANPIFKRIKIGGGLPNIYGNNAVAFITYYDGRLYLGNFNSKEKSIIKSFKIKRTGDIDIKSESKFHSNDFLQGITFYKKKKKIYLLTSSSYSFNKSILRIYEYKDSIKNLAKEKCKRCILPPMLEQICFNKEGYLIAIFESNAKKYKKYRIENNDINEYNIDSII